MYEQHIQGAIELTRTMVHRYYRENDVEAVIALMDEDIIWLGAGEQEYAAGRERVAGIFRRFQGQVPRCRISDEEYRAISLGPEVCLCSGRMWIATDASTQISLRVHQRITTAFRWTDGVPRCCHIHISNPYIEMTEDDVGFPTKMARQSYQYLQEQIEAQKKLLEAQTALLQRMSYEDALTGLYNRNKYSQALEQDWSESPWLGVACFDLNGLKQVNDQLGHSAGDTLICRAARQLRAVFDGKAYRIGGDEFVIIDDTRDQAAFQAAVRAVEAGMDAEGISHSVGVSWHASPHDLRQQVEEADQQMYQDKRRFYSAQGNDRRHRQR